MERLRQSGWQWQEWSEKEMREVVDNHIASMSARELRAFREQYARDREISSAALVRRRRDMTEALAKMKREDALLENNQMWKLKLMRKYEAITSAVRITCEDWMHVLAYYSSTSVRAQQAKQVHLARLDFDHALRMLRLRRFD